MALEDTFEHEGMEITYVVHANGREAVARFVIGEVPHELVLRRGHRDWSLRGGHFGWISPKPRVQCFRDDVCAKLKLVPDPEGGVDVGRG